jgi:hypothetical protein
MKLSTECHQEELPGVNYSSLKLTFLSHITEGVIEL